MFVRHTLGYLTYYYPPGITLYQLDTRKTTRQVPWTFLALAHHLATSGAPSTNAHTKLLSIQSSRLSAFCFDLLKLPWDEMGGAGNFDNPLEHQQAEATPVPSSAAVDPSSGCGYARW